MKHALIVSAVCILLGLAIAFVGMIMLGFDFAKLYTTKFETETVYITEPFRSVAITTQEHDIRFALSEDDRCKIVYTVAENMYCKTEIKNQTLYVTRTDVRHWYERIGIHYGDFTLTVYLPEAAYEDFDARSASGNIDIPIGDLSEGAYLSTESGDIRFTGDVGIVAKSISGNIALCGSGKFVGERSSISASTTSGDITVHGMHVWRSACTSVSGDVLLENCTNEHLTVKNTSGNAEVKNSAIDSLTVTTTSGDTLLTEVVTNKNTTVGTASGNVRLDRADLSAVKIKTISGDVKGTLTKAMEFYSETVSGNIRFPASDIAGGYCKVITTSGDVNISIAE